RRRARVRRRRRAGPRARQRGQGVRGAGGDARARRRLRGRAAGVLQGAHRAVQGTAPGRVPGRPAAHRDGEGAALRAAPAGLAVEVLQPPGWPRPKGYANGLVGRGRLAFVAGQIGWDEAERLVSDDLVAQAGQALRNVLAVVAEAGGGAEHVARLTWYVVD